jgi:serine/threonine protein kinase
LTLTAGTHLAHYEIESLLGAGGMREVYRARDTRLERPVALKVLPDAVTLDAGRLAWFEREARVIASMNEPGIVTVHAIESAGTCRFIVTELIEGRELTEMVPPQGLPLGDFLDLGVQWVRAIVAAHRRGILIRDLKPANVMGTHSGRVKVLDFGLGKFHGDPAPESER